MKKSLPYRFRSNAERRVAEWLKANGIAFDYEGVKIPYTSRVKNGQCPKCASTQVVQRRSYTPDFQFRDYSWHLEVKGRLSASDRQKLIDIKKCNPDLQIRLLLLRDNKLRKNNEKRYSSWCLEHGFLYAVANLPISWFKPSKA